MSKIKYSLNISEVTAMSIPGFPASSPHPHLGWCISLLCGKDVDPGKQSWHPHLHVWGPLGGWSGAAGGPIVFFFCFLNFFCHFSCPGPAFRGVQLQPGRKLHPFLLGRLWGEVKKQVQWVRMALRDDCGSCLCGLSSVSENTVVASGLCLLPWSEREPGWKKRGRGQRKQRELWSGGCTTPCKFCKQLLQAIQSKVYFLRAHYATGTVPGLSIY